MTALAADKPRRQEAWRYKEFTLKSGSIAYKGGRAAIEVATGKVVPASSATGLVPIGVFFKKVDASLADKTVTVDLEREVTIEFFANAGGGDAVLATDVGTLVYMLDDATVTRTATGRSIAGVVWQVDSTKGVGIQKLDALPIPPALNAVPSAGSFTANDWAPTGITQGGLYVCPTTAAASTITLPAAASDGTVAYFTADGTANGHTVQYRDATGPTNLTTALTASKRHLVVVSKVGGKWFANAYVSP